MKIRLKMKNRSHRYDINRHGHKYIRYKMCLSILMVIYRETDFADKLVSQGNLSCRETGFPRKLISQGNLFLVFHTKIIIYMLVMKQITYNAKVIVITIL